MLFQTNSFIIFTCPNPVLLVWASDKWSSVKTAILKALKSMNRNEGGLFSLKAQFSISCTRELGNILLLFKDKWKLWKNLFEIEHFSKFGWKKLRQRQI
jgi:hypothetical protein